MTLFLNREEAKSKPQISLQSAHKCLKRAYSVLYEKQEMSFDSLNELTLER